MKKGIVLFWVIFAIVFGNMNLLAYCEDNAYVSAVNYEYVKKDPKLIELPVTKKVNQQKYSQKILTDNKKYAQTKTTLNDEQYHLYVIFDKLLRSNKLQNKNWRIGINISPEDINASAGSANLITINSSLYDSLYNNTDAIAFVVAHELAHLVMGHNQISLENNLKIQQLDVQLQKYGYMREKEHSYARLNSRLGYSTAGNDVSALGYSVAIGLIQAQIDNIFKQERNLELDADREAITMMTRAGYDANKAFDTLDLLSALPNIYTSRSTHPDINTRNDNIKNEIELLDFNYLKEEGKQNILNSNVLNLKKSSDKVTIILTAPKNNTKQSYIPVTQETKYLRKGYQEYLNNNLKKAAEYFRQARMSNPQNYIAPLYLSYVNEELYLSSKNPRYLKFARKNIKKAKSLKPTDGNVLEQEIALKTKIKDLKQQKKQQ